MSRLGSFPGRVLLFGEHATADVRAGDVVDRGFDGTTASVQTPAGVVRLTVALPGRVNLMNVLAAVTVALFLGGIFALIIRFELLTPERTIISATAYNRMFTLHGIVMIFLFMIPAILLSGNMTPIIAMPEWMQPITFINPMRWYIEILRANLLEGSSFPELWRHALALMLIGSTLFVTAVRRFRMHLG